MKKRVKKEKKKYPYKSKFIRDRMKWHNNVEKEVKQNKNATKGRKANND